MNDPTGAASVATAAYQVGGALRPHALYLPRATDLEAEAALFAGDAVAILGPRQLGKSSLRLRLAARLRQHGLGAAQIDLSGLGTPRTTAEWIQAFAEELALEVADPEGPPGNPHADPVVRLTRLLEQTSEAGPWVLFVDELDTLILYPEVADVLLGALRAAWDREARTPGPRRFRLCLAGVVAPFELGLDPHRSPFNVARPIVLADFSPTEAAPLAARFPEAQRAALLDALLDWTHGQPYLSQRLAERIAAGDGPGDGSGNSAARVAGLVERLFLRGGAHQDANLAGVLRRVTSAGADLPEVLALYRRVLTSGGVEADGRRPATAKLLLSGLVEWRASPSGVRLVVRNRIYALTFDLAWVEGQVERRPFVAAMEGWQRSGDPGWLLRGEVLETTQRWATGRADLSQEEMAFLLHSADAWRTEEAGRAELEHRRLGEALVTEQGRRAAQRIRALTALASVLAVAGLLISVLAVRLADARRASAAEATRALRANVALLVHSAEAALLVPDLARAEVLAAAALRTGEDPRARGVLLQAAAWPHPTLVWERALAPPDNTLSLVAAGGRLAAPDGEDLLLLDGQTGATVVRLAGGGQRGRALSADGTRLLSHRLDGNVLTWTDARTGQQRWSGRAPGAEAGVEVDFVALDGDIATLVSGEGQMVRWRLPEGEAWWRRPTAARSRCMPAPSPDGALLAVGCTEGRLMVLDSHTGLPILETLGTPRGGFALAWAGATLLFGGTRGGGDGTLYQWSPDGGAPDRGTPDSGKPGPSSVRPALSDVGTFGVPALPPTRPLNATSIAVSDPRTAWVGLDDGTVAGVNVTAGALFTRASLNPGQNVVAADGELLYTFSRTSPLLRAWKVPTAPPVVPSGVPGQPGFSVDTTRTPVIAAVTAPQRVTLVHRDTGETLRTVDIPAPATRLLLVHGRLWIGTTDGTILREDNGGWQQLARGEGTGVSAVVSDRSGDLVAALRRSGPLVVWRGQHRKEITCDATEEALALHPEGAWLAAGCTGDGGVRSFLRVWAVDRGDLLADSPMADLPLGSSRPSAFAWMTGEPDLLFVDDRVPHQILHWTPSTGVVRWPGEVSGTVLDLSVAPGGASVAGLDTDGKVYVWGRDGALRARFGPLVPAGLRLHLDDTVLNTLLADGRVARWPLESLAEPPEALYRRITRAWGMEVLEGETRVVHPTP